MRPALVALCAWVVMSAATAGAQTAGGEPVAPPLTRHELLKKYVWSTLGVDGALHATFASAFDQWRGSPEAWPDDTRGYAQRWASQYAASAIGSTTKYVVARMFAQDPSFVRCECTGLGPRLGHAAAAPFKARTRSGEWVFSPATLAGLTAENVVPAATWYPAPRGARDGAAHALGAVASKMAVDVIREFMPRRVKDTLERR